MSTTIATDKDRFLEQLDRAAPLAAYEPLRQAGRDRFRALPWPGPRTEDWRSTSIAPLLRVPFEPPAAAKPDAGALPPLPTPDTLRLVFVNGAFQPALSALREVPNGILIGSLAATPVGRVTQLLGSVADFDDHIFTALNSALVSDGAYVVVPDGQALARPVEIVYLTQAAGRKPATQPRTLIVAGKMSQVTVVERYLAARDDVYFTNAVTEIAVAEQALVDHYKLQEESRQAYHVANTQVVIAGRSTFSTHYLALGGQLVRNEVRVRFEGEQAEATVNGLYLATGTQHIDNFTEIDHALPHCASHELYKGILDGQAHGVFNGKIKVRPDAQKTDAKQTNKVLLLSDDATINTKPQLEIFADDVKCTHGATVGQLDADMLFYLRARGIDLAAARSLLTFAFANDIVNRIKVEALRDQLEERLVRKG